MDNLQNFGAIDAYAARENMSPTVGETPDPHVHKHAQAARNKTFMKSFLSKPHNLNHYYLRKRKPWRSSWNP